MSFLDVNSSFTARVKSCTDIRLLELGLVPETEVLVELFTFGMIVLSFRGSRFGIRESDYSKLTFH